MGKRWLFPSGNELVTPRPSRYLRRQGVDPRLHTEQPPPPADLQLMALIWATWDQGDPTDFSALQASPSLKGYNWPVWEEAITKRINYRGGNVATELVQDVQRFWVNGEAVLDLASMFDLVFLGHWLPVEMVQEIKARSTAPNGTKVVMWSDFESISQNEPYSEGPQAAFSTLREHAMLTAAANSYGDFAIDKFELTGTGNVGCPHTPSHAGLPFPAPPPSTHSWDIDIQAATGGGVPSSREAEATIESGYLEPLDAYRDVVVNGPYEVAGVALDNLLENPFKGSATNDYAAGWTADYRDGWLAFLDTWLTLGSHFVDIRHSLWCNGPIGVGVYPVASQKARYVEHFFRSGTSPKSWVDIGADLGSVKTNATWLVLAGNGTVGQTHVWATTGGGPNPATDGTWQQIVSAVRSLGIVDDVWVAACQTLAQGHTFWQHGFRHPT
jgi:hypothetical protein